MIFKTKYLKELAKNFSSEEEVITEIVNLEAILNLPKGTEYFISDIHGEFEGFNHIMRTGAGTIKEKIALLFTDLSPEEQKELSFLVSYPEYIIKLKKDAFSSPELISWYYAKIKQLIQLTQYCSSKYSRSKLRKALPKKYHYIIEELIYVDKNSTNKEDYYNQIISKMIELKAVEDFLAQLSITIQKLVIDHIHIVGDIFDRGKKSDQVMDLLMGISSLDIQWGNHDLLWMAAFCGSEVSLVTLLRIAVKYGYMFELEEAYGLNFRQLFLFAQETYQPNAFFYPESGGFTAEEKDLLSCVHQALLMIQLKLEHQVIERRPDFEMEDRLLLKAIQGESIEIDQIVYPLKNHCFQTVDLAAPQELISQEAAVLAALNKSFTTSIKLIKQMKYLFTKGSMYLVYNNNLLFHGCIPLNEAGFFETFEFESETYKGRELFDFFDTHIKKGYEKRNSEETKHHDLMWYGWTGKKSPLYGRKVMTTFERYFIEDTKTHKEKGNPYYDLRDKKHICELILREFGINPQEGHIINGHTPIKVKKGESPVKAEARLFVIDGGMSEAYQKTTGIAGYTLLNNSYGFQMVTHRPFDSINESYQSEVDSLLLKNIIDENLPRKTIRDTSNGQRIKDQIVDLTLLLKNNSKT